LDGDDGGTFLINLKGDPSVAEADGTAQCTITMDAQDFVQLVESRGDSRQLFFMGKLRVEGDIGLAMKLRQLTEMFK
jgi:putative sterol carrier protein